ncbi:MgtE integral membrane region [Methanocorpusculum labreanum Z]|uniref:MgtE integral membrane region n=1 Tax=Methanocorpusculum labreanum (strain ATCC 43576 / DSM 4855 / Z) TaxID=410358 RepID=A2SS85_METLZ|nr:magnesium transporter [Methanocorpusculum labreanum]ABN07191.1 MgtE integral membrane region [Methanocorpusculum labreanum Z]
MKLAIAGKVKGSLLQGHDEFFIGLWTLLLSVSLSFIAGIYLGAVSEVLILIPGLMVLVTPSINMRGAIAGILTSRLSSSMHLGAFEAKLERETELGDNLRSSIILTVMISAVLAVFGKLICLLTGTEVIGIAEMIIISVTSGTCAGLVVTAVGVFISVICYRKSWNLDMVGAPVVTTVGDIVTLPFLVITAILVMQLPFIGIVILGIIVLALIVWAILSMHSATKTMKDVLREGLPLLVPLCLLGIAAGVLYTNELEKLIAAAAVLILISPFMNGCGSIGGILTSRIGTEMHMGLVDAKVFPQILVWKHFFENYLYALLILPLMGLVSHYAAVLFGITTPGLVPMILLSLCAGMIVITVMNLLGYFTAVLTYRLGYDPDNFGVPVVTSSIDLVGATALISTMMFMFV